MIKIIFMSIFVLGVFLLGKGVGAEQGFNAGYNDGFERAMSNAVYNEKATYLGGYKWAWND